MYELSKEGDMELAKKGPNFLKLPLIGLDTKIAGTRELQKMSSKSLEALREDGPQIISVGGEKKAVLVDYSEYVHFQRRFEEMFKLTSIFNQFIPKFDILEGFKLQIDRFKLEVEGTLEKIVIESPKTSPFADLMDAIMSVAGGLFGDSENAPVEMRNNAKTTLEKGAQKSRKKGVQPKKYIAE